MKKRNKKKKRKKMKRFKKKRKRKRRNQKRNIKQFKETKPSPKNTKGKFPEKNFITFGKEIRKTKTFQRKC